MTTPAVVALHGFTRSPQNLQRLADACSARGWACVRPALAPRMLPALYMDRRRLTGLAGRLAPSLAGREVAVVGHSAGAAAGTFLAGALLDAGVDVRGLVMVDGVDSPNHLIARGIDRLEGLSVSAVLAPASRCNRDGALGRFLAAYPWVRSETVAGAGHGDIEGAGIGIYRRACGDDSDAATVDRVMAAVLAGIGRALDR